MAKKYLFKQFMCVFTLICVLFFNTLEISAFADTDTDTEDTLPSSVDNTESKYFPPVVRQTGGNCAGFAVGYFQYTYTIAKALDIDYHECLLNAGYTESIAGGDMIATYNWLCDLGTMPVSADPSRGIEHGSTNVNDGLMETDWRRASLKYKLDKSVGKYTHHEYERGGAGYMTEPSAGDIAFLQDMKKELAAGKIIALRGGNACLIGAGRDYGNLPECSDPENVKVTLNGEKVYGRGIMGHSVGGHVIAVVGYNDDVEFEYKGYKSKGGFKIADTNTSISQNGEFYWVPYNKEYFTENSFFTIELAEDYSYYEPEYYGELTIAEKDCLPKLNIDYTAGSEKGSLYEGERYETWYGYLLQQDPGVTMTTCSGYGTLPFDMTPAKNCFERDNEYVEIAVTGLKSNLSKDDLKITDKNGNRISLDDWGFCNNRWFRYKEPKNYITSVEYEYKADIDAHTLTKQGIEYDYHYMTEPILPITDEQKNGIVRIGFEDGSFVEKTAEELNFKKITLKAGRITSQGETFTRFLGKHYLSDVYDSPGTAYEYFEGTLDGQLIRTVPNAFLVLPPYWERMDVEGLPEDYEVSSGYFNPLADYIRYDDQDLQITLTDNLGNKYTFNHEDIFKNDNFIVNPADYTAINPFTDAVGKVEILCNRTYQEMYTAYCLETYNCWDDFPMVYYGKEVTEYNYQESPERQPIMTFEIKTKASTAKDFSLNTDKVKKTYQIGEPLNLDGAYFTGRVYSDNYNGNRTLYYLSVPEGVGNTLRLSYSYVFDFYTDFPEGEYYTVQNYDPYKAGKQTVTVHFMNLFSINEEYSNLISGDMKFPEDEYDVTFEVEVIDNNIHDTDDDIYEDPPAPDEDETGMKYDRSTGKITISAKDILSATLVTVKYTNRGTVEDVVMEELNFANGAIELEAEQGTTYMLWEDIYTMRPLCDSVEVK